MTKSARSFLFAGVSLITFLLLNALFFMYFYASHRQDWLVKLFMVRIMYVPIYIYLVIGSLLVGFLVTLLIYLTVRQQLGQAEQKLTLLANGQYEADRFKQQATVFDQTFSLDFGQTIEQLRQRMIQLQQELQAYSNHPQTVAGETKEEILTQERHRLARELHDSVSQQLFAAMMMLSALNEIATKPDKAPQMVKQLQLVEKIINEAQSEMRALLLHLRPISLEGRSLKDGIIQLLRELQTKIHLEMTWQISDVQLESGIEDNLFRIVQELLSNTLRHSKAKTLEVYLKQVEQTVILKVVDDGVGFDMRQASKAGSYGLKNIQERATGIGGHAKVISFPKQGTSVEIRVPLVKSETKQTETQLKGGVC
ncbi:sensor histidine kinase [Loigolactobacillus bifermentans]|uniref:Sensor histidine kinase n=1 Tax=Loigolactobacillus bifermentans DSM 20003 TaxID=1423726 RepID=A0A0R1H2U3_9LACO|nr:sensor histidine kinase [Loigolactobacillus bifermentans]KRK40877.1 two-component system, sensor histidine kinase [Loigolactobacillus bifermentans DSM 20003]QGG59631.1 sensor histidine kinase [Loigolactobacillus bifermentans]